MVRSVCIRSLVFGITVLIVSHPFLDVRKRAFGQEVSKDAKADLKERDRLWNQTQKLRAAGKLSEAIAASEAMLAIERKVLPAGHADLAVSLDWLAMIYSDREDFAAAKVARQQALEVLRKRYGETHWKVTDARLALEDVDRRARMTRDQRQSLAEADRLNREVVSLHRAGKDGEALESARRVLALRKGVLGERHRDYAQSLNNLAYLLASQGDYAAAAPLLKPALETTQGNLDLAAVAQSERQQLAMAHDLRWELDAYLSLAPMAKLSPGDAYRHVLTAKGSVFEKQRRLRVQRRRLQADPQSQAARRFADYEQTVKQLAALALATPDPKQAQGWRTKIADLARRTDELEAELARLDAGFRAERAEASRTPEQLQAALPTRDGARRLAGLHGVSAAFPGQG